jgi:hypothetical protein
VKLLTAILADGNSEHSYYLLKILTTWLKGSARPALLGSGICEIVQTLQSDVPAVKKLAKVLAQDLGVFERCKKAV